MAAEFMSKPSTKIHSESEEEDDKWNDTLLIQAWNRSWTKMKKAVDDDGLDLPIILPGSGRNLKRGRHYDSSKCNRRRIKRAATTSDMEPKVTLPTPASASTYTEDLDSSSDDGSHHSMANGHVTEGIFTAPNQRCDNTTPRHAPSFDILSGRGKPCKMAKSSTSATHVIITGDGAFSRSLGPDRDENGNDGPQVPIITSVDGSKGRPSFPPSPVSDTSCDTEKEALASMLISWYMTGYHTGFYQGTINARSQRGKKSSDRKDSDN